MAGLHAELTSPGDHGRDDLDTHVGKRPTPAYQQRLLGNNTSSRSRP